MRRIALAAVFAAASSAAGCGDDTAPGTPTATVAASPSARPAAACAWRVVYEGTNGGGAGSRTALFRVANRSGHACRLSGVPAIELTARGRTRQRTDPSDAFGAIRPRRDDVVAPQRSVAFAIVIENDPAFRGRPQARLTVRLPGTRRSHVVPLRVAGNPNVFDPDPDLALTVTRIGTTIPPPRSP